MDNSYSSVKVLYYLSYKTRGNYCVSIKEGEKLILLEKTNEDWWKVKRQSDRPFYVPSNYVKETPQATSRPSLLQKKKDIQKEKPMVKQRTVFEIPLDATSKNIPLKTNTEKGTNENSNSEKMVHLMNQIGIQNNNKVLSPTSDYINKTVITIDQDISGYCVVTAQNDYVNKDQCTSLSSSSFEGSPQRIEVDSTSSNTNTNDTIEQKTLQSLNSLKKLAQQNELKLMSSSEITEPSESNTVPCFTKVKISQKNVNKLFLESLGNSTDVEKLNKMSKLRSINRFKTQHERNQWAKNMIDGNKIEKTKLNDKE